MSANMTQGEKSHQGGLPRPTLIGAACLVLLSLGAVAFGRATDIGVSHMAASNVVATRDVNFMDRSDGGVDVIDGRQRPADRCRAARNQRIPAWHCAKRRTESANSVCSSVKSKFMGLV